MTKLNIYNSILTLKAPKKIPDRIITERHGICKMFDTKSGEKLGEMGLMPMKMSNDKFYPKGNGIKGLYIAYIKAHIRDKKVGTGLINAAKQESLRQNCNGRMYLYAREYGELPQIFYYKQGFTARNKLHLKYIELCAKLNLNKFVIPYKFGTHMHYIGLEKEAEFRPHLFNYLKK